MKHITLTILSLLFVGSVFASSSQAPTVGAQPGAPMAAPMPSNTSTVVSQPNNSSFAVTLARQAGAIGGAAQACHQDISLLSARLDEAITAAAQSTMDSSDAVAAYQQSVKEASNKQAADRPIPCEVVLMDYKQIPLLRDDYREVVLSALKAEQAQYAKPTPTTTPPATPTTQQPQAVAPAPMAGQATK
jgi:hypothetical protein